MGQVLSSPPEKVEYTRDAMTHRLAGFMAEQCFTSIELLSLKDVFRTLTEAAITASAENTDIDRNNTDKVAENEAVIAADDPTGIEAGSSPGGNTDTITMNTTTNAAKSEKSKRANRRHLTQQDLTSFLSLPDIPQSGPTLYKILSYLAAYPFLDDAPTDLRLDHFVVALVLLTKRYKRVWTGPDLSPDGLLFQSLALVDNTLVSETNTEKKSEGTNDVDDEPTEDQTDLRDALVEAGFSWLRVPPEAPEAMASRQLTAQMRRHGTVPLKKLRSLIMLLLVCAGLDTQESLARHAKRFRGRALLNLHRVSGHIVRSFVAEDRTKTEVDWPTFQRVLSTQMPFLLQGMEKLLERFLFSEKYNFASPQPRPTSSSTQPPSQVQTPLATPLSPTLPTPSWSDKTDPIIGDLVQPLLPEHSEDVVMNVDRLSQLALFLPGADLFRRLRLLYSGSTDGFSMGSLEAKVFNWRAPTLLLVRGSRIVDDFDNGSHDVDGSGRHSGMKSRTKSSSHDPQEEVFLASIPGKKHFPPGCGAGTPEAKKEEMLTFGVYVSTPWKHTFKECFGGPDTTLFQLEPVHDVFRASTVNTDYITLTKAPNPVTLAFGCPHPTASQTSNGGSGGGGGQGKRGCSHHSLWQLGSVSLRLDASMAYGVFHHDYTARGGAFHTSATRRFNFQERFVVESVEVWGCGGDAEARLQAERWAWEAREAEARRKITLGTGDIETDRALLEMAGLVGGGNRSGGSMS